MSTAGTTLGFLYDEGKILFCFLVSGPIRAGLNGGNKKYIKKRNKKTKSRTKEHVSFIGQLIKIGSRDPDTSVFRGLEKKTRSRCQINEIPGMGYPGSKRNRRGACSVGMQCR